MTDEDRKKTCRDLADEATSWIISRLEGYSGIVSTTDDLNRAIYGWLVAHAIIFPKT